MKQPFDLTKLNVPGVRRGFIDHARRAATPYVVRQDGLCEDALGQRLLCEDREERRLWMIEHCVGEHEIEPMRAHGQLTGYLYRFADWTDAFGFRMRF